MIQVSEICTMIALDDNYTVYLRQTLTWCMNSSNIPALLTELIPVLKFDLFRHKHDTKRLKVTKEN